MLNQLQQEKINSLLALFRETPNNNPASENRWVDLMGLADARQEEKDLLKQTLFNANGNCTEWDCDRFTRILVKLKEERHHERPLMAFEANFQNEICQALTNEWYDNLLSWGNDDLNQDAMAYFRAGHFWAQDTYTLTRHIQRAQRHRILFFLGGIVKYLNQYN